MKRGLFIAPFDELVDPRVMADVAAAAEDSGWDGLFVWDHVIYRAPVRAVADPWIVLSAVACATKTLRLGPLVTPPARRRISRSVAMGAPTRSRASSSSSPRRPRRTSRAPRLLSTVGSTAV